MDEHSVTANEAATAIGVTGLELRNRLRAERPVGAIQIPNQKNGRWYLAPWYVTQLVTDYRQGPQQHQEAPSTAPPHLKEATPAVPLRPEPIANARDESPEHWLWSDWVPFELALKLAPRFPGVYMFRVANEPTRPPIYIGMAGERKGSGVRGRLAIYARGRGATSGLGEHALDRALADPVWLRARLEEALEGRPLRATLAARSAIDHAGLEVRWQTVPSRAEALKLEAQLIDSHPGGLWNR